MNHDRLTLYYRSTISHFLLDLLNPTGTDVGAAAPLPPGCTRRRPASAEQRPGRSSAVLGWAGTWGQRLPIIHMQNKYIILHLYHVLLTKYTALPQLIWKSNESLSFRAKDLESSIRFFTGCSIYLCFLEDLTIKHLIEQILVMYDFLTGNLQHLQAKTHVSCTKNDKTPLLLSIHCS